jgi:hypothetical protein
MRTLFVEHKLNWSQSTQQNASNYVPYNTAHEFNHYFVKNRDHVEDPDTFRTFGYLINPDNMRINDITWTSDDLTKLRSDPFVPSVP